MSDQALETKDRKEVAHSGAEQMTDAGKAFAPNIDIYVNEDELILAAELPGVEKEDLRLHVTDDSLEIKTEGAIKFFKVVSFETPVQRETAKATYKNGVLSVWLQKKETEKKRTAITLD